MNKPMFAILAGNTVFALSPLALPETPVVSPEVVAHAMVFDRSGSMYSDIEPLKQAAEQALVADTMMYNKIQTSLISFSSDKDCTLHWSHIDTDTVLALDQPYLRILRSIQATYYTGISQGLAMALKQVRPNETTAITIFTDGYANDPSPKIETERLRLLAQEIVDNYPRVFVNFVGYRDYCDWPLMNELANKLSGQCVKARSFKDVQACIRDTNQLIGNNQRSRIVLTVEPNEYVLVVNNTTGQVNYAQGSFMLPSVDASHDVRFYRVQRMHETNADDVLAVAAKPSRELMAALSLGLATAQMLRPAKDVMKASGNLTLWARHATALSATRQEAWIHDLRRVVRRELECDYGSITDAQFTWADFSTLITKSGDRGLSLDLNQFLSQYRRRGEKSLSGTRDAEGNFTPFPYEQKVRGNIWVTSLLINQQEATINLQTRADADLVDNTGSVVTQVAGVDLRHMSQHRMYTLLSSGEPNVASVPLIPHNKIALQLLQEISTEKVCIGQVCSVPMSLFGVEEPHEVGDLHADVTDVHTMWAADRLARAFVTAETRIANSIYTEEQLKELRNAGVTVSASNNLNFGAPTVVEFPGAEREKAIRLGLLDSYTRYQVAVGSSTLMLSSEYRSGNDFFKTFYEADRITPKKLSARVKVKAADRLMLDVWEKVKTLSDEERAKMLQSYSESGEQALTRLRQLTLVIGSMGALPDVLSHAVTRIEAADAFTARTGTKLSSDAQDGMFYTLNNDLVVGIVPTTAWYRTA